MNLGQNISYEERLRQLELLNLEKRRLWESLNVAFSYLKVFIRKRVEEFGFFLPEHVATELKED